MLNKSSGISFIDTSVKFSCTGFLAVDCLLTRMLI